MAYIKHTTDTKNCTMQITHHSIRENPHTEVISDCISWFHVYVFNWPGTANGNELLAKSGAMDQDNETVFVQHCLCPN
jgi:hypothetical protein